MIQRCHSKKHRSYVHYGAQGVEVVERWRKFDNFLADMGHRPEGKTLGRLTPFSNYGPGECEWQTSPQQNSGLLSHADHVVTVNGISRSKRAWARLLKISYSTLLVRIRKGWGDAAYTTPRGKPRGFVTMTVVRSEPIREAKRKRAA